MGQATTWVGKTWLSTYHSLTPLISLVLVLIVIEAARLGTFMLLGGPGSLVGLDLSASRTAGLPLDIRFAMAEAALSWLWTTVSFVVALAFWSPEGIVLSARQAAARGKGHWSAVWAVATLLGFVISVPESLALAALASRDYGIAILLVAIGLGLSFFVAARWMLAVAFALEQPGASMQAFGLSATAQKGTGGAAIGAYILVALPLVIPIFIVSRIVTSTNPSVYGDAFVNAAEDGILGIVLTILTARLVWEIFHDVGVQPRGRRSGPPQP